MVRSGKEAYLQMLLVHNFMHADLHPGNILLKELPGRPPTLVLVDAGMVDELTASEQENFVGLFRAMGKGDGREAAARLLGFSAAQPGCGSAAQREAFGDTMAALFDARCRGFRTGVCVGPVLREILSAVREHQARRPLSPRAAARAPPPEAALPPSRWVWRRCAWTRGTRRRW